MKRRNAFYILGLLVFIGLSYLSIQKAHHDAYQEEKKQAENLSREDWAALERMSKDDRIKRFDSKNSSAKKFQRPKTKGRLKTQSHTFGKGKTTVKKAVKPKKKVAKKKKVKKKAKKPDKLNPDEYPEESDQDGFAEDSDVSANETPQGGGAIPFPSDETEETNEINTVEYWRPRVVEKANYKESTKLLNHVQLNEVDLAVFYQIVDEMLLRDAEEVRRYGIIIVSRVPSVESFELLILAMQGEKQGTKLRALAEESTKAYGNRKNLQYLARVIRIPDIDAYTLTVALNLINDSANQILKSKEAPGDGNVPLGFVPNEEDASFFNGLLADIEAISKNPELGAASDAASHAFSNIQSLLNT